MNEWKDRKGDKLQLNFLPLFVQLQWIIIGMRERGRERTAVFYLLTQWRRVPFHALHAAAWHPCIIFLADYGRMEMWNDCPGLPAVTLRNPGRVSYFISFRRTCSQNTRGFLCVHNWKLFQRSVPLARTWHAPVIGEHPLFIALVFSLSLFLCLQIFQTLWFFPFILSCPSPIIL